VLENVDLLETDRKISFWIYVKGYIYPGENLYEKYLNPDYSNIFMMEAEDRVFLRILLPIVKYTM